jgi:hypothetical protein
MYQSAPKTTKGALNCGSFPSCHRFEGPSGPEMWFSPLKKEVVLPIMLLGMRKYFSNSFGNLRSDHRVSSSTPSDPAKDLQCKIQKRESSTLPK